MVGHWYGLAAFPWHRHCSSLNQWRPFSSKEGKPLVIRIVAEPAPIDLDLERTALIIIDMQRDFLEPGGFGETLGNDVSLL